MCLYCTAELQGLLDEAWCCEGHMLQEGWLDTRWAPLKIKCVAIHLLEVPIHCTQLEVVCPLGGPAA